MIKSVSLDKTPKIIINPEIHIEKPVIKEGQQAKIDLEMEKACNAIIEEQNKKAAEIYYQLLKYVRKHFKETITSIGVLPLVLYNYARVLDLCGRYEEGAALAKEGREACIQYGHYQVLPRCLEIEAECRHFMGDDEISKELYYQSYYLCKVIGYQIGLEVVKKEAKEYLNIDFMS